MRKKNTAQSSTRRPWNTIRLRPIGSPKYFPKPWKTIELRASSSFKYFGDNLRSRGCVVEHFADEVLSEMEAIESECGTVDLVIMSNDSLGFPDGCTSRETYDAARRLGLELCPPAVGPELRLEHNHQTPGQWLLIAMEPIKILDPTGINPEGLLSIFSIENREKNLGGYGLHIEAWPGQANISWLGHHLWVFTVPRK